MDTETLYLVMPAYNEEDNISDVVLAWNDAVGKALLADSRESTYKFVIADCGSTDRTHEILCLLSQKIENLEILKTENQFHGPKVLALYQYAIDNGATWIFQTDSDGQTESAEFQGFWESRHDYDAVLGIRSVRGDGKARAFVEKVVCKLLKIFFGVEVRDANAPFRLMKSELVARYIGEFEPDYNIPNIVFTAFFAKNNEKVLTREITFNQRAKGDQHLKISGIMKIGISALRDFWNFRKSPAMHIGKVE